MIEKADKGHAIRRTAAGDRQRIEEILVETDFFRSDEVELALEVLDDAIKAGPSGHYQSFTLDVPGASGQPGHVAGWVCFGPTPGTIGTFDIYWIAVDMRVQAKGLGTALLHYAEAEIQKRDGRLCIIETSGRALYEPTQKFYLSRGYAEAARIRDFYVPGDDKITYTKYLTA